LSKKSNDYQYNFKQNHEMKKYIFSLLLFSITHISLKAQLTYLKRTEVIDSVIAKLNRYYIFPEMAKQMGTHLRKQLVDKKYETVSSESVFADILTAELQKISNDKHLHISFSATILHKQNTNPSEMPESQKEQYAKWLLLENYGIKKLEVLPGNIGYIDFKWFCGTEYSGNTYAAALNYLNHTEALIIDLRGSNGAMSQNVIPFLCSYFFKESTHLSDFYWREKNETIQTWTQTVVPGEKYLNKPIYILTSGKTFSGAEELAYDLKQLKRAVLIGETTGGGANGGGTVRLTDHFEIFIPNGRAINPITKTNWEGTGVQPDSMIKSNKALYFAQTLILKNIIAATKDFMKKMELSRVLTQLQKNPPSFKQITFTFNGFENAKEVFVAGSFNYWSPKSDKLERKGDVWITSVEAEPGEITYKFIVDGRWILDPANKETKSDGQNTNSVRKFE
jgi:Peptidase family S41/N-terminal domain of Peptidase_S41 in eukaryotic IRBP/Glycogen recognition site of AMP-activated protein kinase